MFNFLKLHSSSSGDARRHVPFASIIHKHIFPFLIVLVFFFTLCFRPYAAEALAQLTPEIQPVYNTTIESLYDFVKVQLDDTHKQVFDLFLGSYMVGYAGMSDYKLNYQYNSDTPIKEWLINSGVDLYNSILSLGGIGPSGSDLNGIPKLGYQQLSPLIQTAMGCALKANNYNSVDDAFNDITSSTEFPIPLTPDIMFSLNSAMGYYNGLYNWQFKSKPFTSNTNWLSSTLSGSTLTGYNSAVNNLKNNNSGYTVRVNYQSYYNCVTSSSWFDDNNIVFINTSNSKIFLLNKNTLSDASGQYIPFVGVWNNGSNVTSSNIPLSVRTGGSTYDPSLTVLQAAQQFFNNNTYLFNGVQLFLEDFVDHVYYGINWASRQELYNIEDLNLDVPDTPVFYPGIENGLLDLTGMIQDLIDQNELRQPIINNYYYPNGDPVPEADLDPAMQNESDVDADTNIDKDMFVPLFVSDGKDSFISYMWYMTKPLIIYTKDLVSALVFDPVDNFAASGPGYFFYGVIGLGLISGLVVKCLL